MIYKSGVVWDIFNGLKQDVYRRDFTNNGHDYEHIERMLAMRQMFWPAIIKDEPQIGHETAFILDCAILFHDLNRVERLRGKGPEMEMRRMAFARTIMDLHNINNYIAEIAIETIQSTFKKDEPSEQALVRLLRDFDKADMGAVGIYRMAAVADSRKYGVFVRPEDFNLDAPAIKGDENLDSFCADIKFCHRWWLKNETDGDDWEIRTPAIRERVAHRFEFMKTFLKQLESEMSEIGLV